MDKETTRANEYSLIIKEEVKLKAKEQTSMTVRIDLGRLCL